MGFTRSEQETHISWDEELKVASIYTASTVTMRRLDNLCEKFPNVYKCVWVDPNENYPAKKYEVQAKYIRFGKPPSEAKVEAGKRIAQMMAERAQANQ